MLTKPTDSTSCFKYVCSENAQDIFAVFRENAARAKEIVLWRNKYVCRTTPCSDMGFCLSLNCSVKPLFSIPWQPRYSKCLYRRREKLKKEYAEVFKTFGPFATFLRGENGIPVCLVCSQQVSVVKKYRMFR